MNINCHYTLMQAWLKNWFYVSLGDHHTLTIQICRSFGIATFAIWSTSNWRRWNALALNKSKHTGSEILWNPNIHSSWPSNFPQAIFWSPLYEQSQYPAAAWATLVPWTNCRWTRWCWTIWLLIEGPVMGDDRMSPLRPSPRTEKHLRWMGPSEILHHQFGMVEMCWNPINNGIKHLSTGGFRWPIHSVTVEILKSAFDSPESQLGILGTGQNPKMFGKSSN